MEFSLPQARECLASHGQEHVLAHWDHLDDMAGQRLLGQVAELDFTEIARMQELLADCAAGAGVQDIEPAAVVPVSELGSRDAIDDGENALRANEVGVILVAGGQGSRLGFDGPKGCFPVGPVSQASLFEIHARKILALEQVFEAHVPFYIMTSRANDADTRLFFEEHEYFGLNPERIHFFAQGMWPVLWGDGRIVLCEPGRIFMSPDGHGGLITALAANGILEDMKKRSLQQLFFFQVDNPLVEIADPAFIGLHRRANADIAVKVCAKRGPDEGLGVVATREGRSAIVEYTELTEEQKTARLPNGKLRFLYGSVGIHVFSRSFLEQEAATLLPLHVAHKAVPYCGQSGQSIVPDSPNAYKFEKFIFDVVPHATRVLNVEFLRENEFSPVKNAEGEDSPATSRRDISQKVAGWLQACGVDVPRDDSGYPTVAMEIDSCAARNVEALRLKLTGEGRHRQDAGATWHKRPACVPEREGHRQDAGATWHKRLACVPEREGHRQDAGATWDKRLACVRAEMRITADFLLA